jgi:hypothetical protein
MILAPFIRIRDSKVVKNISEFGRQSLRKIAEVTGLSKDAVSRSLKSLKKRNQHPESLLWETEEGQAWLNRMFCATLYEFGIKGNQGADRINAFFKRIRVETHIGVSPTALRTQMQKLEESVAEFQKYQEIKQSHKGDKKRESIVAGDETFFKEKIMLVLLDMPSGYLIVEEEANNRSYETWESKAQARLNQLGLKVRHFVSDRGKSLMKLATVGFGCYAGADLFHAQFDISKWLGRALLGKLGQAVKQLKEAKAKLVSLEEKGAIPEKKDEQECLIKIYQKYHDLVEIAKKTYNEIQQAVSGVVHAFSLQDNQAQTSEQVESLLEEEVKRFEKIADEQAIKDKKNTAGKFRRQIKDVSSVINAWWLWTKESLSEYDMGKEIRHWLLYVLLPVLYWYNQRQKTQHPELRKEYETAWKKALASFDAHPLTCTISDKDMEQWLSWGEWACNNFHRTSSAVEGRNGYLSQCYHNGRGMTKRRQKALTAIHNYDIRRRDGTTPAQRLYGVQFEDMFEWLLGQMGALPLPRKARKPIARNPLKIKGVSA